MGAADFVVKSEGQTANEAFRNAVREAQARYGNGGYTGTIAEKESFVIIPLPEGEDPYAQAAYLLDIEDERIDDKWGPAGCFELKSETSPQKQFLFFGWASE